MPSNAAGPAHRFGGLVNESGAAWTTGFDGRESTEPTLATSGQAMPRPAAVAAPSTSRSIVHNAAPRASPGRRPAWIRSGGPSWPVGRILAARLGFGPEGPHGP